MIDPARTINEIRRRFGDPPRSFGLFERFHWHVSPPSWCSRDDELRAMYEDRCLLRDEGIVIWGAVVQANQLMFRPGRDNCPGCVIFSFDTRWSDRLVPLAEIAHELFELKHGESSDPAAARFGAMLADEYERAMGLAAPPSLTAGRAVVATTVVFHRKHLPGRKLANGFLPLLVHKETAAAFVLPGRYWTEELCDAWQT